MTYLIAPAKDAAAIKGYADQCDKDQAILIECRARRTRADLRYDWYYLSQEDQAALRASAVEIHEFFLSLEKRFSKPVSMEWRSPGFLFIDRLLISDVEQVAMEIHSFLSGILKRAASGKATESSSGSGLTKQ